MTKQQLDKRLKQLANEIQLHKDMIVHLEAEQHQVFQERWNGEVKFTQPNKIILFSPSGGNSFWDKSTKWHSVNAKKNNSKLTEEAKRFKKVRSHKRLIVEDLKI